MRSRFTFFQDCTARDLLARFMSTLMCRVIPRSGVPEDHTPEVLMLKGFRMADGIMRFPCTSSSRYGLLQNCSLCSVESYLGPEEVFGLGVVHLGL